MWFRFLQTSADKLLNDINAILRQSYARSAAEPVAKTPSDSVSPRANNVWGSRAVENVLETILLA